MNNVHNSKYSNEIKIIKDSIGNTFNKIEGINFDNKHVSKLCFNFIKGHRCKWNERGKCHFAHSIEELSGSSILKVLELGMEAYYYIYGEKEEKDKNFSIFDLVKIYKDSELLFRREHYNLYRTRIQYNELHKYIFKMKKELEVNNEIGYLHLTNHINELINSDYLDDNIMKKFGELKILLNSTIGCKICYKNIIELNDTEKVGGGADDEIVMKNYNIITLSCGHSICEHCHIELINQMVNIYIECPLCRNINNINNTVPNYELNEQIFKIKLIFSKLNKIHNDIKNNYTQLNTNNFIVKNKNKYRNGNGNDNTNIIFIKSFEAPW